MEHTLDEDCGMYLTVGACDNRVAAAARQLARRLRTQLLFATQSREWRRVSAVPWQRCYWMKVGRVLAGRKGLFWMWCGLSHWPLHAPGP